MADTPRLNELATSLFVNLPAVFIAVGAVAVVGLWVLNDFIFAGYFGAPF